MAMTIPVSIYDRVAKGVELLDRVRPGWAKELNSDRLLISNCGRCVLGQLYGHYVEGHKEVFSTDAVLGSDYGFDRNSLDWNEYDQLLEVWKREIAKRV